MKQCAWLLLLLMAASCANRVAPTGGEKDTTPPKVLEAVPENYALHFSAKEIRIKFDEYVSVNDLQNQLIVSPLTVKSPVVKTGKKELIIEVPDSLKPNTTYTFNFGKAIVDVHESNPLEDFKYVFSTGDYIDSLQLSGEVRDALSGSGTKGVTVLVYRKTGEVADDSLPLRQRPLYFARTNDKGMFRISNMAEGEYFVFAVEDKNGNYYCDRPSEESFAFLPRALHVPADSVVRLKTSLEYPAALRMVKMSRVDRRAIQVYFNKPDQDIRIMEFDGVVLKEDQLRWSPAHDTVTVFDMAGADSLKLVMSSKDVVFDTLQVRMIADKGDKEKELINRIKIISSPQDKGPAGVLRIQSQHPLKSGAAEIQLQEDSSKVISVPLIVENAAYGLLRVDYPWKEGANYKLVLPPGHINSVFDARMDTARFSFRVADEKSTAILSVKLEGLNAGGKYIFQLLNEKSELLQETKCTGDTTIKYSYLSATSAKVRVIHDLNGDGHWTPGSYAARVQPEPVFNSPDKLTLRANWELETIIKPEFE